MNIETKLFPNEETGTPGKFIFADKSQLNFNKETQYYPQPQGEDNSFSINLMRDLVDFKTVTSNTNEIGFEVYLKDGSMLRQVPLGKPLPPTPDDYVDPPPTSKEMKEARDDFHRRWKLYAPEYLKEMFNEEFFLFDKSISRYVEIATGKSVGRRELLMAMREVNADHATTIREDGIPEPKTKRLSAKVAKG